MATRHRGEDTGFALRWLLKADKTPCYFPGKRAVYLLGLEKMCLKGCGNQVRTLSVCVSPTVSDLTRLVNEHTISAIKTEFTDTDVYIKDYSQRMDYFTLDFRYNDRVHVWVVDEKGNQVDIDATVMLDIREYR